MACVAGHIGTGSCCWAGDYLGGNLWRDFAGDGRGERAEVTWTLGGRGVGEVGVRSVFGAGVVELEAWGPTGAGDPDPVSGGRFPGRGFEGFGGAGGLAVVVPGGFGACFRGGGAVVECPLLFLVDAGFALDELDPCAGFCWAAALEVEVPRGRE